MNEATQLVRVEVPIITQLKEEIAKREAANAELWSIFQEAEDKVAPLRADWHQGHQELAKLKQKLEILEELLS